MPLSEGKKPRKPGSAADFGSTNKKAKPYQLRPEARFKVCAPLRPPPEYDERDTYNWRDFLERDDFGTAPVQSFATAPLHDIWQHMCQGMKMEVPNKDYALQEGSTVFWVASVQRFAGYKILLRYEGLDKDHSYDFWMNLCAKHVHPIGWCAKEARPLVAPKCVQDTHPDTKSVQDWKAFLCKRLTGARTLPMEFNERVLRAIACQFRVGMHVELMDREKLSQVRPAVIKQVCGHRLRIQYTEDDEATTSTSKKTKVTSGDDEEEEEDEFWCHIRSPLLHPVGWAIRTAHEIKCSQDYLDECKEKLKTGSYGPNDATPSLFPIPPTPSETEDKFPFEPGMKLEAVDPLDLSNIVIATISKILNDGYMMISFDGTSDSFCYHRASPSIFPAGFCESQHIHLQPLKGTNASHKFNWPDYLRQTKSNTAPVALFTNAGAQHLFSKSQKLECTDLMDPRLVCVATVAEVQGSLLRIHFDGWEDSFDQWVDSQAAELFPIGYCEMMGNKLEPPKAATPTTHTAPPPKKKAKPSISGSHGHKKSSGTSKR